MKIILFQAAGPWGTLSAVGLYKDCIKTIGQENAASPLSWSTLDSQLIESCESLRTSKQANFQVDHQLVGRLTFLL